MLLSRETSTFTSADNESIHNYYERMVFDEIHRALADQRNDIDLLGDIACVALNHLPPRYIRHDVDMAFYLSPREQMEMEDKVKNAVQQAIMFVQERGRSRDAVAE
jgi:hypothetical protein